MKRQLIVPVAMLLMVMVLLSGCGGNSSDSTAAVPTKVIVKFSTEGTLAPGIGIGTIKVTASLPAGLSVKGTPNANNPAEIDIDTGSLEFIGAAASNVIVIRAAYIPATNSILIDLFCPSLAGLPIGEFAVVRSDITADTTPNESAIQITSTRIGDNMGNTLTGMSVTFTAVKE